MSVIFDISRNRTFLRKDEIYNKIIDCLVAGGWEVVHTTDSLKSKVLHSTGINNNDHIYVTIARYISTYEINDSYDINYMLAPYGYSLGITPMKNFSVSNPGIRVPTHSVNILGFTSATEYIYDYELTWYVDKNKFFFIVGQPAPNHIYGGGTSQRNAFIFYGLTEDDINPNKIGTNDVILAQGWNTSVIALNYPTNSGLTSDTPVSLSCIYQSIPYNPNGRGDITLSEIIYGSSEIGNIGIIPGLYAIPSPINAWKFSHKQRLTIAGKKYEILGLYTSNGPGSQQYFAIPITE